jgi:hypothetical protein
MKGRLGKASGLTATALKIARIIYSLILSGQPYQEKSPSSPTSTPRKNNKNSSSSQPKSLATKSLQSLIQQQASQLPPKDALAGSGYRPQPIAPDAFIKRILIQAEQIPRSS